MPRRNAALDRAAAAGKRGKGRPPAGRREHRVRFSEAIARGVSSERAAVEAGVLPSIGVRWFRKGGGCRLSRSRRYPGAICSSTSGRRSRFFSLVVVGCERSRVSWVAHRRRSPGSCSETLRCGPVGLSIEPRPRRPMLTAARGAPSRRSLRSTWSCGAMCSIGSPGLCGGPMGASRVRRSAGAAGVTARERTGVGDSAGARSRSPLDYRLTSLMMSRCASPIRRSTSRCMCRDAERCAGS